MKFSRIIWQFSFCFLTTITAVNAQPILKNDYSYSLKIPQVVAMKSSAAHLYVLSGREGMAVFRTHPDSLQWLYTASGMQQRGHKLRADIRFAYLFGRGKRLTVLEPTSTLGAYSATVLPQQPLDTQRFGDNLYVALGAGGMGKLNLKTPETLDTKVKKIDGKTVQNQNIIDLEASADNLYALSANKKIFVFDKNESGISFNKTIQITKNLSHLFFINHSLAATTKKGNIFEISADGQLSRLGSIGEPVVAVNSWKDWLLIKGSSNRLWISYKLGRPVLWKKDGDAGNFMAFSKGQFWLCQYNRISRVREAPQPVRSSVNNDTSANATPVNLKIMPVKNQEIPYPHALLIPLKLKNNYPVQNVEFNLKSEVEDARIQGQSLYWSPSLNDEGEHKFKIIATAANGQTSSTTFMVNVSRFNSPPRFTPLRTISIPVGRPFNLPVSAIDPDATNKKLIRYLGVNLPKGATLNERTGQFSWSPTERQLGKNTFRVIATDQYGAASSEDVTIRVINTRGEEQ